MIKTLLATLLAVLSSVSFVSSAHAQAPDNYPTKPVTIVVPYPPGGSNDVFARIVAKELTESLKQAFVVENRPGASGNTGTAAVVRAPADGYTLVAVSSSMTTNAAVQTNMPFDPVKSLSPVAMFAQGPFIIAVNNDFPVRGPADLLNIIRGKPGAFNYGSSGLGSVNQFGTELLKAQAGRMFITHIPYRGMAPAVTDLVSGQTQMIMASGPSLLPMVRAGKIRAVAVTSAGKSAIAPDLEPMSKVVPGYEFALWWGLLAPANTPASVVNKLNAAVNQILAKPAIEQQFLREGAESKAASPSQFAQVIAQDIDRWKRLAKQQNIVAE